MKYKPVKATVGAILYPSEDRKDIILMTKRNISPFKDQWCLPGGHIEAFEPTKDAIVREVKEETAVKFQPEFMGWFEEIFPDMDIHHVALFFHGQAQGRPAQDEDEVSEVKWMKVNEALQHDLAFLHDEVLEYYKYHVLEEN